MSARNQQRALLGIAFAALFLAAVHSAAAAAPDEAERIQAHLAAGEFTPALNLARQTEDVATRNEQLAQIAAAQQQAGARQAAINTLSEVADDQVRTQVIQGFLAQQVQLPAFQGGGPTGPGSQNAQFGPATGVGGGPQADFDSLIDLITSTIAPTSWIEVGGTGSIAAFPGGVYVDPAGVLRKLAVDDRPSDLAAIRRAAAQMSGNENVQQSSALRKVSLPRLEKYVQLQLAAGLPISEDALALAGLERIRYILIYPEQGEIVLAGPASGWKADAEGRLVSERSGRPVLRLDDLIVILRHSVGADSERFGCSITPTQEALARTQEFLAQSSKTPLKPGRRDAWLEQLRSQLGQQQIDIYGIDPRSHVGRAIVEADYHMKLVGLGLEEGVVGVPSYFDSLKLAPGQAAPPLGVLRWWFTLNYDALRATPERDAFELRGQGVKVLSENELLTEQGERVHTGQSDVLNAEFAHHFTAHFGELSAKYPLYVELQNIFDLALVAALLRSQNLPEATGWHMSHFLDAEQCPVEQGRVPATVETVIAHKVVNKTQILAAVSGGVTIEPGKFVQPESIQTDDYGLLKAERLGALPADLPRDAWWWD